MELRVETAEGCSLPAGCHVGIRIGDVLKQGRYEPQRCYNFPQVERRRTAKIDLYQHIGTCVVTVDPEAKSTHEVQVQTGDPDQDLRLKVNSRAVVGEEAKSKPSSTRETRSQTMKLQAKDYLSKHSVEERLSEAVKALLKEQPSDPTEFLCRLLRGETGAAAPVVVASAAAPTAAVLAAVSVACPAAAIAQPAEKVCSSPKEEPRSAACPEAATAQPAEKVCRSPKEEPRLPEPPAQAQPVQKLTEAALAKAALESSPIGHQPQAEASSSAAPSHRDSHRQKDLAKLRVQAREVLIKASETGDLGKVMDAVRTEVTNDTKGNDAKAAPGSVPVAAAPAVAAPVVAGPLAVAAPPADVAAPVSSAPLMVPSLSMRGPTFATLGMPLNMMVF